MNRFDSVSKQLLTQSRVMESTSCFRIGTWVVFGIALGSAVGLGLWLGANPIDKVARALSELPLTLLLVDFWALTISFLWNPERTPLRVPVKTPIVLLASHFGFWVLGRYLISFDLFYRLEVEGVFGGRYLVQWGTALLLGLVAFISLTVSFFESRLVQWVLISEGTAVDREPDIIDRGKESDIQLGLEYLYEAQIILHNLGYDVGGIDGEMNEKTEEALKKFQLSCGLKPTSYVTALTLIELRSLWEGNQEPPPGQSAKAFSGHLVRKVGNWISNKW